MSGELARILFAIPKLCKMLRVRSLRELYVILYSQTSLGARNYSWNFSLIDPVWAAPAVLTKPLREPSRSGKVALNNSDGCRPPQPKTLSFQQFPYTPQRPELTIFVYKILALEIASVTLPPRFRGRLPSHQEWSHRFRMVRRRLRNLWQRVSVFPLCIAAVTLRAARSTRG